MVGYVDSRRTGAPDATVLLRLRARRDPRHQSNRLAKPSPAAHRVTTRTRVGHGPVPHAGPLLTILLRRRAVTPDGGATAAAAGTCPSSAGPAGRPENRAPRSGPR